MQNQSSISLAVPHVSKVRSLWRGCFTRKMWKMFYGLKYDERKTEMLFMYWHCALCCKSCACGVSATAETEHLPVLYHGLCLTNHKDASSSFCDKPEVWNYSHFCHMFCAVVNPTAQSQNKNHENAKQYLMGNTRIWSFVRAFQWLRASLFINHWNYLKWKSKRRNRWKLIIENKQLFSTVSAAEPWYLFTYYF